MQELCQTPVRIFANLGTRTSRKAKKFSHQTNAPERRPIVSVGHLGDQFLEARLKLVTRDGALP
jgi:hypothetical protein